MEVITTIKRNTPLDTGYSWLILIASTFMYGSIVGNVKAFGIIYNEFLEYYAAGSGNTAWIGGIHNFLAFSLGPFSNHLCGRYSFRTVFLCGGVLYGIGFFASAFVPNIYILYLTFGTLSGIGAGLILAPSFTFINFYFDRKRALANGIYTSGASIGAMVFPYFYKAMIDLYGVHGTLMLIGGIFLNMCVAASLCRQPNIVHNTKISDVTPQNVTGTSRPANDVVNMDNNTENASKEPKNACSRLFNSKLLKSKHFYITIIAFGICSMGKQGHYLVLPAQFTYLGFDERFGAIMFSVMGGVDFCSKLFYGWFIDLNIIKARHIFIITLLIEAVAAFCVSFFHTLEGYIIYAVIYGMVSSPFLTFLSSMLLEHITVDELLRGMGMASFVMSIGHLLSFTISGWIEDTTGSWDDSFRFFGATHLLSAILVILGPFMLRNKD